MNATRARREWDAALAKFRVDQKDCEWSEDAVRDLAECFLWENDRKWEEWARALGMNRALVIAIAADIITEVGIKVEDPFP